MAKIITDESQMQCSLGTQLCKIKVTSQSFIKIADKLIATESDINPIENIPSFDRCKRNSHKPACIPQPQQWENTAINESVNNLKKLTIESTCQCTYGGTINFIDTGANRFVNTE